MTQTSKKTPQSIVVKFGGTSVNSRQKWDAIATCVTSHEAHFQQVIIVVSALRGVSDLLAALPEQAKNNLHSTSLTQLHQIHLDLAEELEVSLEPVQQHFETLEKLTTGIWYTQEYSDNIAAQISAIGELISSCLGFQYLTKKFSAKVSWWDIRQTLITEPDSKQLEATCNLEPEKPITFPSSAESPIVITQGYIAQTPDGQTALLGRGGSDLSAAYIARYIKASQLEIWTDVAGVYSADPRLVEHPHKIQYLSYAEAREMAALGSKVLHPRCLDPIEAYQIPATVRSTGQLNDPGTAIGPPRAGQEGSIQALATKSHISVIHLETTSMWQQVGFLADFFGIFKECSLSVDLVSTSETGVTVTLDSAPDEATWSRLAKRLLKLGQPTITHDCASISLVGNRIRSILPHLASALEVFQEYTVYLLSQSANDRNLTFVVHQDQAQRLVQELHARLFKHTELQEPFIQDLSQITSTWWYKHRASLEDLAQEHTPSYCYHLPTVRAQAQKLFTHLPIDRLYYAVKANDHPAILKTLEPLGVHFECVSLAEINYLRDQLPGLTTSRILFTPNFAPTEEYRQAFQLGVQTTIDNSSLFSQEPELFKGVKLALRVDLGVARGHHKKVQTAGKDSKFGINVDHLPSVLEQATRLGAKIIGLHTHAGSGITDTNAWLENAYRLLEAHPNPESLEFVDLGGGLPVPEFLWQQPFDLEPLGQGLVKFKEHYPHIQLWMEPGRYLVAEAGVLLTQVTQTKHKRGKYYIGVDAGMHDLIRPSLYGAHHPIISLSNLHGETHHTADIVGPICESGDILGRDRALPETRPGDILAILTAGAYGRVMASNYNRRLSQLKECIVEE